MENEKSLYDILNEAAELTPEREQEIKNNASKIANELLDEITTKKEDI